MIHEFISSNFSSGNVLFPFHIIIDSGARLITIRKRKLIGYNQTVLKANRIVSVHINRFNELLFLSGITITTASENIYLNGFIPKDAIQIQRLIESLL